MTYKENQVSAITAFGFVGFVLVLGPAVALLIDKLGLLWLNGPLLESGIYSLFLGLPVAYFLFPWIFAKSQWRATPNCLKVILLGILLEFIIGLMSPASSPISKFKAFGLVLISPMIEEIARAAVVVALTSRWGLVWGITSTTVFFACIHSSPLLVVLPQALLTMTYLYYESVAVTSLTHSFINAVVVLSAILKN